MQHVWVLVYINISYAPEICFCCVKQVCNDVPFVSFLQATPLYLAAANLKCDDDGTVKYIIDHGAESDVNIKNAYGVSE